MRTFFRHDGPTWIVAVALYASWAALIWFHASLSWYISGVAGMPWWEIPGFWRANRQRILEHNGGYYFRGYGEIAAKWLFRPVFLPPHPKENFS